MEKPRSLEIIAKAIEYGASLAGIAASAELAAAPSYSTDGRNPSVSRQTSILVLALAHPLDQPELDWWDGDWGTPGNRQLIEISLRLGNWLRRETGIDAGDLPYYIEAGGVFLKDAAVLAGLGVIGENNLLIAPGYGPRIRLRALQVDRVLPSSPRLNNFLPCRDCSKPCLDACPNAAFSTGQFSRPPCRRQMDADEENGPAAKKDGRLKRKIHYCRECERVCLAG